MIQVTMKDQCLSEPSQKTLKRIERAEDIDDWVKDSVKMYRFLKSYAQNFHNDLI